VTTFNEELPDETWKIPDPHPSAVSATTVQMILIRGKVLALVVKYKSIL
jgi:hypothetical protein